MYRQGDLLLVPIDTIPKNRGRVQPRDRRGRVVMAEGEVTGHAHAIRKAGARLYGDDVARRFLRVFENDGVDLVHEEHATIHLAKGAYRVIRQIQWIYPSLSRGEGAPGWIAD